MATAQDVLDVARSLIGISETPDGSNIAPPITTWAKQYGYSTGDAWCSWTVSYEFYHTDPELIYNHPSGYSGYFRTMGEKHNLIIPHPKVGAIDVMDFDGKPDFTDHVGIVESVNTDGSWVNIEGNHNNQVMRVTRKPGGGSHWFILPKYAEAPKPKSKEDGGMLYEGDGKRFVFEDCYAGRYNYWLHTRGKADEITFTLTAHNTGKSLTSEGQPLNGHKLHDLQAVAAYPKTKTDGSYTLECDADNSIHWALREVPK